MEIKMYKNIGALLIATTLALPAFGATIRGMDKQLSEIDERVEDLEMSRDLNTFEFSGELEARYDSINVTNNTTETDNNTNFQNDRYTLFTRLNFQSIPSKKASFFGRLSASKVMNNYGDRTVSFGGFTDGGGGRDLSGSQVYLERAFMNYKLTNTLTFSGGRLPTIDGPSYHMSAGKGRSGSYPSMAFGAIMDGFALTHGSNIMGGKLFTRLIWSPLGFNDKSQASPSRTVDMSGAKVNTSDAMYSLMLDYEKLNVGWADKINFIAQMVKFDELYVDATGVNCGGTGATVCSPDMTNPTSPGSDLYFGYDTTVLYAEFNNMFKTGIDLSMQMKSTTISSVGNMWMNMGGTPMPVGTFGPGSDNSTDGTAMLYNVRYAVNDMFKLGFEYMDADDSVGLFDFQKNDPIGFYSTPFSTGKHLYLSTRIDNNFSMIAGYMTMDYSKEFMNFVFQAMPLSMNVVDKTRSAMYVRFLGTF